MELEDIENEFDKSTSRIRKLHMQRDLEELDRLKATEEQKQAVKDFYAKKSNKLKKVTS